MNRDQFINELNEHERLEVALNGTPELRKQLANDEAWEVRRAVAYYYAKKNDVVSIEKTTS